MEPPPEVLPPPPCLAPAPSRIRGMAPTMRFSRRHMPCACLRRGITPGGGCLFFSPMLTNEVRYMGTLPSRAQQPPEGGCLRPQNSRLWPPNVRSASRCNHPPGVVAVGPGVSPRRLAMLANTGLLKMEPPPEVLLRTPCLSPGFSCLRHAARLLVVRVNLLRRLSGGRSQSRRSLRAASRRSMMKRSMVKPHSAEPP